MSLFRCCVLAAALFAALSAPVYGHSLNGEAHDHAHEDDAVDGTIYIAQANTAGKVSGQGDFQFRVRYRGDHLPAEAIAVLVKAHGGFAVDRRANKGEVYFALPGAGIIQLSADFSKTTMIPTAAAMRNTNMHNATIWYDGSGGSFLTFPANDAGKVFTTRLNGDLVHTLEPPKDFDFDEPKVNKYFADGGKFVPTDVEYLDNMYYISTGYSPLDYVLTASVSFSSPFTATWHDLAFGGKGSAPGQFGTGHGITLMPDGKHLAISDRPNSEVEEFTRFGHYRGVMSLPKGSFPCDIDYTSGYAIVGCLHGPDRDKGAPIYIVKDGEVISTVMAKEDLGLENFQHIHNAVMINRNGRFYIIAQAWNPGGFAVLEQVID